MKNHIACWNSSLHLRETLPLWLGLLTLFLCTLSGNLSISHDSIFYLQAIERGFSDPTPFHPHHLLFNPIATSWVYGLRFLGATAPTMLLVESMNSVLGASSGVVVYLIMRNRFALSARRSLLTTALASLSFGHWYHSVCLAKFASRLSYSISAQCTASEAGVQLHSRAASQRGIAA